MRIINSNKELFESCQITKFVTIQVSNSNIINCIERNIDYKYNHLCVSLKSVYVTEIVLENINC